MEKVRSIMINKRLSLPPPIHTLISGSNPDLGDQTSTRWNFLESGQVILLFKPFYFICVYFLLLIQRILVWICNGESEISGNAFKAWLNGFKFWPLGGFSHLWWWLGWCQFQGFILCSVQIESLISSIRAHQSWDGGSFCWQWIHFTEWWKCRCNGHTDSVCKRSYWMTYLGWKDGPEQADNEECLPSLVHCALIIILYHYWYIFKLSTRLILDWDCIWETPLKHGIQTRANLDLVDSGP